MGTAFAVFTLGAGKIENLVFEPKSRFLLFRNNQDFDSGPISWLRGVE